MQNIFFLNNNCLQKFILLFLFIFSAPQLFATHIRAGEITAERISNTSLRYRFTVTVYTDNDSPVDDPQATLFFGDGTQATVDRFERRNIANNSSVNIYIFEHTFPGPGEYRITYTQVNRNGGVLNMTQSDQTPFSVETVLLIDPFVGLNSTPKLTVAPLDLACVGQRYTHNAGAFDPDGDSLSYRLTIPKRSPSETVLGYLDPDQVPPIGQSETGGTPNFQINPVTGDLTWDSPSIPGEYNVAFVIEEWRNGIRIGYVVRDMQIIVLDCNNRRPEVIIPPDTCVTAGSFVNKQIRGIDPDGHPINLYAEGGILEADLFTNPAVFITGSQPQPSPASGQFNWQTNCDLVRTQPYQVVFRAEDNPPAPQSRKLVDVKSWLITVVGPSPQNLTGTASAGRSIDLSWDAYSCPNADSMIVWRREGCFDWIPANCEVGAPAYTGYIPIAKVPINQTNFTDSNNGQGLKRGLKYSYRVSATFPQPAGGESYVSNEVCLNVRIDAPLPIRVSVERTGTSDGEILVKWARPLELTTAEAPPPYRYRLFRAEGLDGNDFTEIYSETDATIAKDSLEFLDTGLNTQDLAYSYRVVLDNGSALSFRDSSDRASSVRLTAEGAANSIRLTWTYNVPWTNNNQIHRIYREVNGVYERIDEIEVGASGVGEYFDRGAFQNIRLDINEIYCYYVETSGTFDNPLVITPLLNKSQVACASPIDSIAPCPPILAIDSIDCVNYNPNAPLRNTLTWQKVTIGDNCEDDINFYRLYYAPTEPGIYQLLIETTNLDYIHDNLESLAGCYVVTAVDFAGNESEFSNQACKDNCVFYKLPNVITPNDDGKNDIFRPFPDYRFVEGVEFTVYNHYGVEIYTSNEIEINWDGEVNTGSLPSGAYFYSAIVRFTTLRPEDAEKELKGWIQIIR